MPAEAAVASPPATPPAQKRRGCAFWLTWLLVLGLIVLVALAATAWWGYRRVARTLDQTAIPTPVATLAPERVPEVQRDYTERDAQLRASGGGQFTLSVTQLNEMIAAVPKLRELRERVHVSSFDQNRVTLQLSIPLDRLGLAGQYFNGPVVFALENREGQPALRLAQVGEPGKGIPNLILASLVGEDLLSTIADKHPAARQSVDQFRTRWQAWEAHDGVLRLEWK